VGPDSNGHGCAQPGGIGFPNQNKFATGFRKPSRHLKELGFGVDAKYYRMCVRRQISGATLSGGVAQLGELDTGRHVGPDAAVVIPGPGIYAGAP